MECSDFGEMVRKKLQQSYTCLTLFKQDVKELVWLFQRHLQDVEIIIDGNRILDVAQLEQFAPAHQVQSLVARGRYHEMPEEYALHRSEPLHVELKMSRIIALLIFWKEADEAEPEIIAEIRKLLLRCLNRVHQFLILSASFCTLFVFSSFQPVAQQHHLDFLAQLLLEVGGGIPLGVATFILFIAITHQLRLDTRVFLFPGATETTKVYGRRETIGTIAVALILLMLVAITVALASRFLWR